MDDSLPGELFGGHSITEEMFNLILELMPDEGGTLLELGSGRITELFTQHFKVYSVEDDPYWVDTTESTYIYAPLIDNQWYDPDILAKNLPKEYDMLLVDGPRTQERRAHLLKHTHLFRADRIWIFDDINQPGNYNTFNEVSNKTGRTGEVRQVGSKVAGILFPEQ